MLAKCGRRSIPARRRSLGSGPRRRRRLDDAHSRLAAIPLALLALGCFPVRTATTVGPKIDIEEIKKLNDATTKADVARSFGKPAIPRITPDGVEAWTFSSAEEPGASNRWKGATRAVNFFFRGEELRGYALYSWDTLNAQESTPKVISWVSEKEKKEGDSSPAVATASVAVAPMDPGRRTEVLKGKVSSTPTGARIFAVSENGTERPLGTTPQEVHSTTPSSPGQSTSCLSSTDT